jgi:drug/metabolite transporter (DMT)-like permease
LLLYVPVWLAIPIQSPLVKVVTAAGASSIWFQLFYLGVITSGVGYGLWYIALSKLPSSNVAVFNNLQPVLTSVLALLLFGLEPSGAYLIGGALALLGVVVTQRS